MAIPTQITNGTQTLQVTIDRSPRLSKTVRWSVKDNILTMRVPLRMAERDILRMLDDIKDKAFKQMRRRAAHQSDETLEGLAKTLNHRYFNDELRWRSIRWVTTMEKRLGSCTVGGESDGEIRISAKLQKWPRYVLEYVVAHELCHRRVADHSAEFWQLVARYPQTERARGFIDGIAFAEASPDLTLD